MAKLSLLGTNDISIRITPENLVLLEKYNTDSKYFIVPDFIDVIGNGAFSDNNYIEHVKIQEGVYIIGENAFRDCLKLKSVDIEGNTITTIANRAFFNCGKLESINLPDNLSSIGNYAFSFCVKLKEIKIPKGVVEIGCGAFSFTDIERIEIPERITEISAELCESCHDLREVRISSKTKVIRNRAFSGCTILFDLDINIPSTLEYIGHEAFAHTTLGKITLPKRCRVEEDSFGAAFGTTVYKEKTDSIWK